MAMAADQRRLRSPSGTRRRLLQLGTGSGWLVLAGMGVAPAQAASLVAVRLWPSADYTRLTLESDGPLVARHALEPGTPGRLVIDVEGLTLERGLQELVGKVRLDDPHIAGVRLLPGAPGATRVVLQLKQGVRPQQFSLLPIPPYQHRLVFDLYPVEPPDPLLALLRDREAAREGAREAARQAAREASTGPTGPNGSSGPHGVGAPPASTPPGPDALGEFLAQLDRLVVVAVDAGHGGEDPGAIGPTGLREKDVTLAVARLLKARLDAVPGMRAVLTRDGDYFVPLHERVRKARRVQADLLVSVHADAFIRREARGASVYALSTRGATSATARWMAERENGADAVGGLNVAARDTQLLQAMLDMSTSAQIRESLGIGQTVLGQLARLGRLHKPAVEQAGFAVLKAPDIPSILVETAFISNPQEEALLREPEYQAQLADALANAIRRHFARRPPTVRRRST
jgi:N-acetylmuramoyl-L-alanine amidase